MQMNVRSASQPIQSSLAPSKLQPTSQAASATDLQSPPTQRGNKAAYQAAQRGFVASSAPSVHPTQDSQSIKQALQQTAPDQLVEQSNRMLSQTAISHEFGTLAPVKAVYVLGSDTTVLDSARSLVAKVNDSGQQEHTAIESNGLSTLGPRDKLTIVGHGDTDSFGGKSPEALAKHLKDSGVVALDKISLKGCKSDQFAQNLFVALQQQGIQVGSITGRTGEVGITNSGHTLVTQGQQLKHQAVGSKVQVSLTGVSDVYASRTTDQVRSQKIQAQSHHGLLPVSKEDICQACGGIPGPRPTGQLQHILNAENIQMEEFILGETPASQRAIAAYKQSRPQGTAEADLMMVQSLTAVSLLHQAHFFEHFYYGGDSNCVMPEATCGKLKVLAAIVENNKDQILNAYGLSQHERRAIELYTDAQKTQKMSDEFGSVQQGWQYVASAIQKLPSTGDLGMIHSGFRIPRDGEVGQISQLPQGAIIKHGHNEMEHGQHHFLSVATTYNVHTTLERLEATKCVIAIEGTSGRYINPFGVQGFATDGGEVLYPPGIESRFTGSAAVGQTGLTTYSIQETTQPQVQHQYLYEDQNYHQIPNPAYQPPPPPLQQAPAQEIVFPTQTDPNKAGYSYQTSYGSTMRRRKDAT